MISFLGGFQTLMDLYNHMKAQRPVLDKKKKFLFFGNHKAGLTSVNRGLLKSRVVLWKENRDRYDELFDAYPVHDVFKFTIVRDPFKRVASSYFYLRGLKILQAENFEQFIKTDFKQNGTDVNIHFHEMYPKAFFNGVQYVDFIARLENIEHDWKFIANKIQCPPNLPKLNKSKKNSYKLDDEAIEIISEIYREDIKHFNYRRPK